MLLDMRIGLLDEDAPRCSLSDDVAAKQWLLRPAAGDSILLRRDGDILCSSLAPSHGWLARRWSPRRLDDYDNQEGGRCSHVLSYASVWRYSISKSRWIYYWCWCWHDRASHFHILWDLMPMSYWSTHHLWLSVCHHILLSSVNANAGIRLSTRHSTTT